MVEVVEPSINPNVNCLEGKRCPNCNSFGPFEIVATMRVLLYDNGTDHADDGTISYGSESRTVCCNCRHEGQFHDFDERS
jgi:hypothetical protein